MKIRVADITEKEKIVEASDPASLYPTLLQVQESGECTFLSPVVVTLSIVREYDHIKVRGRVETGAALACSRCLAGFNVDIASSFTIYLTKSTGPIEEDEIELAEEDLLSVTYGGEEIDLSNEIAEQVLLEIPYKPLCKESCLGLCPMCGADKNTSSCNCMEAKTSMAFSSLGGFKVKK